MNPRIGLSFIGILATSVAACGGGSKTTLTVEDLCTMMASAECSGAPANCAFTPTACTMARQAACMSFVASVNVAPRVFVPGNVGACISATMTAYAKSLILPSDLANMTDKCNQVFLGSVADLAACTTKYDCQKSGDICDKGFCGPQMPAAATNGQCPAIGAGCQAAQYCKPGTPTATCVNKIASGMACDDADPCDDTKMLSCVSGTCAMQMGQGGTCTQDADCLASAPYCNPYAGGKCSNGLTFAAGATSCNDYGGTGNTTGFGGSSGSDGAAGSGGADGAAGSGGAGGADGGGADADSGTTG
jgi:uncharacterized membrane protein YgcG